MLQLLLQLFLQGQGCCKGCCKNCCVATSGCFPTAKAPKRTNSVAGNASDGRLVSLTKVRAVPQHPGHMEKIGAQGTRLGTKAAVSSYM